MPVTTRETNPNIHASYLQASYPSWPTSRSSGLSASQIAEIANRDAEMVMRDFLASQAGCFIASDRFGRFIASNPADRPAKIQADKWVIAYNNDVASLRQSFYGSATKEKAISSALKNEQDDMTDVARRVNSMMNDLASMRNRIASIKALAASTS